MCQIGLGRTKIPECPILFPVKLIPDKITLVDLKTKDRGVPNLGVRAEQFFMPWHPIVNNRYLLWITETEEVVQRARYHYVQIQEEAQSINRKIVAK